MTCWQKLSVELAGQLRADRLDLGVLTDVEPAQRRGLDATELAAERLVLVVAVDHELAGAGSTTIEALRDQPVICSPPHATIRDTLTRVAISAGFTPEIMFESREVSRIRALVAAGLGIAVLPRSDANSPGPEVCGVEFDEDEMMHRLLLCWRDGRQHSPATDALISTARSLYR